MLTALLAFACGVFVGVLGVFSVVAWRLMKGATHGEETADEARATEGPRIAAIDREKRVIHFE